MEVLFGFLGIVFAIAIIGAIVEMINEWFQSINWVSFLTVLVVGGILLGVLFSFTAEGVLVIIGAYIVLIIGALFTGIFKK